MKKPVKTVHKQKPDATGQIVVNTMQVRLTSVDRTPKDIQSFIDAVRTAERIYYPNRTLLYDIYTMVRMDGHLSGIIEKRISNVLNKKLFFEKNKEQVEELDDVISSDAFRSVIREILERKFWGLVGMEFLPGEKLEYNPIPRKHIKPDLGIISREQTGYEGKSYEGVWNLWILGEREDLGLLLKCCPYVIWKKGTMADWAQYIEIFGQPVIITKYDAHDVKTKMELDQMMREAGSSLRLQIPTQASFEMMDGKQSNGNGELQDKFRQACNDELSVIVLGVTETTTSSGSSGYAQSKTHGIQQEEIIKCDMQDVVNALNSDHFLNILASYNLPVQGGRFTYKQEVNPTQMKTQLEADILLDKIAPLGDDYFYETYNRPKPKNYNELVAQRQAQQEAFSGNKGNDPTSDPERKKAKKKPAKKATNEDQEEDDPKGSWWDRFTAYLSGFFE